ncbi:MAG: inositol monophosphatase [Alphaproteobacteria bacterium]|nr:inositol monophosphatase [Alphaproteobacteria bacterium]
MLKQIELYEDLLRTAGEFLKKNKKNYSSDYTISHKQVKSKADLDVNNILISGIQKISGCSVILSEEIQTSFGVREIKSADKLFIVDPIDGTASYVEGFSGYVTQLAYLEKGIPIFSLVFSPENDEMYVAYKDEGAYLNSVRLSVNRSPQNNVVFIDNTPTPNSEIKKLMNHYINASYIECGSIGLKLCKVASGEANVFFKDVIVRDWDLIPPTLILEEAGGIILSLEGKKVNYFLNQDFSHEGFIAVSSRQLVDNLIMEPR